MEYLEYSFAGATDEWFKSPHHGQRDTAILAMQLWGGAYPSSLYHKVGCDGVTRWWSRKRKTPVVYTRVHKEEG